VAEIKIVITYILRNQSGAQYEITREYDFEGWATEASVNNYAKMRAHEMQKNTTATFIGWDFYTYNID
jgi:hypothetical protein